MPELFTALQAFGLPGLCIGALAWYVLRRETAYEAKIKELQTRIETVQDKRVEDAQKMAAEALKLGDALEEQTKILAEVKGAVQK